MSKFIVRFSLVGRDDLVLEAEAFYTESNTTVYCTDGGESGPCSHGQCPFREQRSIRWSRAKLNLTDRNAELDKARALKVQIAQAESRLDATDDEEGNAEGRTSGRPQRVRCSNQDWRAQPACGRSLQPDP